MENSSIPVYDRAKLTQRDLPHMTLAHGSDMNLKSRVDARHASSAADSAAGRFSIAGNAVVTGGTGGLGKATCLAMLQHGLSGLMILDLDVSASVVESIRAEFPKAQILARSVDVTHEERVHEAVDEAARVLGSVDILVCLAGMVGVEHALDMPVSSFRRMLDVNTTGTFICAQAAARHMVRQGNGGRIVITSSISGHRVNYPQPQVAYNASKAALLLVRASLAAEWAQYGITVNSISPGYMDTVLNEGAGLDSAKKLWLARIPQGRMGIPDEVAGVIVTMCSRAGSFMTGTDIVVDGGGMVF